MTEKMHNPYEPGMRDRPKTVAQLITELQALNPNQRVMVRGYEGGYNDCPAPKQVMVELNQNSEWYYGPHDDAEEPESPRAIQVAVL